MALSPGALIAGRFRLEEQIGVGGFGAVWRAFDGRSGGQVALKILHDEVSSQFRVIERFQTEAAILEALDHPNIARAIASGSDGDRQYFAMELVEGRTLKDDLLDAAKKGGGYELDEALSVLGGVAKGLERAHAAGIVHRDIKPSNVMVTRRADGSLEAKILDFGIAKVTRGEGDETTVGRRLGTLSYMSPEQLIGAELDRRSDVFALGVLLFEMLTVRRPFLLDREGQPLPIASDPNDGEQNSVYEVTRRIALGSRPRITRFREDLGRAIDDVAQRAMHAMAEERYASAAEMFAAVEAALDQEIPTDISTRNDASTRILLPTDDPTDVKTRPERPRPLAPASRSYWPIAIAVFALGLAIGFGISLLPLGEEQVISLPSKEIEPAAPIAKAREAEVEVDDLAPEPAEKKARAPKPRKVVAAAPTELPAPRSIAAQLLAELEAAPNDPEVVNAIAHRLEREAEKLSSSDARLAIRRCSTLSALRADAKELATCIQRLRELTAAAAE